MKKINKRKRGNLHGGDGGKTNRIRVTIEN